MNSCKYCPSDPCDPEGNTCSSKGFFMFALFRKRLFRYNNQLVGTLELNLYVFLYYQVVLVNVVQTRHVIQEDIVRMLLGLHTGIQMPLSNVLVLVTATVRLQPTHAMMQQLQRCVNVAPTTQWG